MNKYVLALLLVISGYIASAQCLVNSLTINTGYNPLTGTAIAGGANGAPAITDPHWTLTAVSPGVATAIAATPIAGLVEVVPGNSADIITTVGAWAVNPAGNPGQWISCLNSNTYNDAGTGTPYNMTLGRSFRMCSDDNITLSFYIANDNYISATDIDGTPLSFSQPAIATTTNYSAYTFFTQTVFLTAGTHTIHVVVNNFNVATVSSNPTGLDIYGTVASSTGLNSLVSESFTSCLAFPCSAVCNTISLPDTLHICAGAKDTLRAVVTGSDSVLSILWTPATGLSGTTIIRPEVTAGAVSGYYYLTVKSLIPYNLVVNGDFSGGNTGFSSSYTYVSGAGSLFPESVYAIDPDPNPDHPSAVSFYDHTTGTPAGSMMSINGASTPINVWCETIPVVPNTDYNFSAWAANWSSADVGSAVPILQFKINGILIGTPFSITTAPGIWTQFFTTWNSGINTTANICIYDGTTALSGNDFSLDDISFQQICVAKDSIYLSINVPDTTYTHKDTTICASVGTLVLTAPADSVYLWNTGATTATITITTAGSYWVYATGSCSTIIDTFNVTFRPSPVVSLGNDTSFCQGDSLVLSSVQPAGDTYLWSTGSTLDSIHVLTSGTYVLTVSNGCTATGTIHIVVSPYPVVDLGPDTFMCQGSITLQSSVAYTGPTYLWSTGSGTASITPTSSGTYWLQVTIAGCSGADTVNLTLLNDTLTLYNHDTAICRGESVQVLSAGNPAIIYQWLPTAGVPTSDIGSPLITPDTSAMYVLTASMAGCPDIRDSFFIDVQPIPDVYLGGNRNICQFDTIHINPSVTPMWYAHYTFDWSPGTYLDDSTAAYTVYTAGDSARLILIVTTANGRCTGVDSMDIIKHPGNFASLGDAAVCPHDSVQLKPVIAAGTTATLQWHPAVYLSDSTAAMPWVYAITTQQYWAIATSQYGCRDTINANVTVRPEGVLHLDDSVRIYPGETYQLSPQTNCTSFLWSPSLGLSNAYISNPVAMPEVNTKYIVIGTTEWGCMAMDSINIYVDLGSVIAIPNAFAPGASANSFLKLIKRGIVSLNYFKVYNRWGNVVYESANIDAGWDGKYNGTPQPFDVYVYEVEAVAQDGTVFHKHGNITLIR